MLVSRRRSTRLAIAAVAAVAAGSPAAALGADPGNPRILRIDATGTQTVLAGGAPWSILTGLAVGASGTVYVANRGAFVGEGKPTQGAGIYALTPPEFAITPVATTSPIF